LAGIFAQSALQIDATQQPNLNLCPDWQGTVWQTISETLVLRMVPLMAVMACLYLLVGFFQPLIMTLRTVPRSNKIIIIRMKIDFTCSSLLPSTYRKTSRPGTAKILNNITSPKLPFFPIKQTCIKQTLVSNTKYTLHCTFCISNYLVLMLKYESHL